MRLLGRQPQRLDWTVACPWESGTLAPLHFHDPNARWLVRRSSFRQKGVPHPLIVLSDVSRALREEERGAWQSDSRARRTELNNSLTPIKSIAGSLKCSGRSDNVLDDASAGSQRGSSAIGAHGFLNRFLQAYRQLAQMPPPFSAKLRSSRSSMGCRV